MRAAIDLEKLGERSVAVDCDVLEADGGTRTASITGGFIALALALDKLKKAGLLKVPVLREQVAAISVGYLDGAEDVAVDLVYTEDSKARVDLNLVATERGRIVEVQATAEGEAIPRKDIDRMIDAGLSATDALCRLQREILGRAGVELGGLLIESS